MKTHLKPSKRPFVFFAKIPAQGVLEHEVTLTYAKLNYAVNTAYDGPAALETVEDDNELTAWPKCMPFALPAKDADSEPSA